MIITFSPQLSTRQITYRVDGDTINISVVGVGVDLVDLSGVEDGVWEPDEHHCIDDFGVIQAARREGGVLYVTLLAPHVPAAPDDERTFSTVEVTAPAQFTFPVTSE